MLTETVHSGTFFIRAYSRHPRFSFSVLRLVAAFSGWSSRRGHAVGALCVSCISFLLSLLLSAAPLWGAEPAIRDVSSRGIEIGAMTTLVVDGDDLGTAPRLLLPFPARQQLQAGATDKRATFEITPEAAVPPGYYQLRIVAEGGVSLPVVAALDRLPQRPFAAKIEQLPVALHGALGGSTVVETKFEGNAGQKVLIEVEAQRLASRLRPIVHLYNARRRQLAWSWGARALAGDARIEVVLPADGAYFVTLHDAEYAVPGPGFFRLKIGQWESADQVFPPVVAAGQAQTVELLGPLSSRQFEMSAVSVPGLLPLAWPAEGLWSGPRPFVTIGTHAEVLEGETASEPGKGTLANHPQELPAVPIGISGGLLAPYEEDRYKLAVNAGSKLRLEVFAERLNSPIDTALVVSNEAGNVLARADDSPGTIDPALDFTVPDKTSAVVVSVLDALGRGGPRGIYRLAIEDVPSSPPDFRLSTSLECASLPACGRVVVPVWIDRRGYSGGVEIAAAGLPSGIKLNGTLIDEAGEGALVTLERGEAPFAAELTTWTGRNPGGTTRPVWINGHPLEQIAPWLATEIAVAPAAAKAADFQLDWRNVPSDAGIVLGGRLPLPIKLARTAAEGVVRLLPLTSQPPRVVNGQPDPNRALRTEKPVELAANVTEGEVALLIPPELPSAAYDIAVLAELLSADKQKVVAAAYAPVKQFAVRTPLGVQLAGVSQIDVALDAQKGATVHITGKIERRDGLTGDVQVTLAGLPSGARADAVAVKADATDFTVSLVLPAGIAAGEIKGLKLSASAPAMNNPGLRVRSRDVELVLKVIDP
jgi:hypothetical protein